MDENVNLVNARLVADERGITISETKSTNSKIYSNLITLRVKNNGSVKQLSGTIFNDKDLRIVDIDGYEVDVVPKGILMVTNHTDQPGIVGKVGTLLGSNSINIASMQLGRNDIGGDAIMVLNIDQELGEDLKRELMEIEGIKDINILNL